MPTISVIVTTYNRPDFLKLTIQSILDQTYKDFELIVVDNYSNYDFWELMDSFNDSRIKPYQNANDGVIAVNRNYGIRKAIGKYIAFCDDDDQWLPDKLEKQVIFIQKQSLDNSDFLIYTNCLNIYNTKKVVKTNKKEIKTFNDLIKSNQITFSTVMVSRGSHEFSFNELAELRAVEDFNLWCELKLRHYQFYLLKDHLINYNVISTSVSNINWGRNHLQRIFAILFILLKHKNTNNSDLILFIVITKQLLKYIIKRIFSR